MTNRRWLFVVGRLARGKRALATVDDERPKANPSGEQLTSNHERPTTNDVRDSYDIE